MLIAITSGGKVGLGLVALVFVSFALVSAFVLPRRNPDFPGERLGAYVAVAALLFVAMMAAVVVFARESGEEGGAESAATTPAGTGEEPTTTQTGSSTTEATTTAGTTAQAVGAGDAAAGKQVFASAGCGGCHTLEAAGSSGNVGPNLDEAKPPHDLVLDRVTNGKGVMPSFNDSLSATQIQNVAAYVVQSTQG